MIVLAEHTPQQWAKDRFKELQRLGCSAAYASKAAAAIKEHTVRAYAPVGTQWLRPGEPVREFRAPGEEVVVRRRHSFV